MWFLVLFFFSAAPAWAEDLGELSANLSRLSGLSGLSGFSGLSGGVSDPTNKTYETD
jgi:hypothetical protein